jgi:hypothetical protein
MSFSIQKDNSGNIIKKALTSGQSAILNNNNSLASSYSTFTTTVNSLTLNNQLVNATAAELNKTIVTPGTASSEKLLVLDSNKNISNINSLSCNDIIINGISLNSTTSGQSNLYLSNITSGTAVQSKTLVLDSNKNISTINSVSTNDLNINNTQLEINKPHDYNISKYSVNEILNNNNNYVSVCWADTLNLFVAISNTGTGNRVITSSDGISWTLQTTPVDNNWTDICWSQQLKILVAISNTGNLDRVMTSIDGITWTLRTTPNNNNWTSICWSPELTLFIAVSNSGTNNRVMTSNNGINWISRTSATNSNWNCICWSPELNLLTVVSDQISSLGITSVVNNMTANSSQNRIATSSSKLTQDSGATNPSDYNTWDPWNTFDSNILTGWHSRVNVNNAFNSSTGIYTGNVTTTDSTNTVHSGEWLQIQFPSSFPLGSFTILPRYGYETSRAPRSFVILGSNNGSTWNLLYTETNKINWIFTPSTFIITNNTTNYSYYRMVIKRTGILDSGGSYDCVNIMEWGLIPNTFIPSVMTSNNGIDWTSRSTVVNNNWKSICWSNELKLFAAISNNGTNRIMTSKNGINWTSIYIPFLNDWKQIIWISEFQQFLIICDNYTEFPLVSSVDGISWKPIQINLKNKLNSICWSSTLKKICILSKSDDSIRYLNNWTNTNADVNSGLLNNQCRSVYWVSALNIFIVTGVNKLITSSNALTWTARTIPNLTWNSVVYSSDLSLLVAVGDGSSTSSSIITSSDGITWTTRTAASNCNWISVCYGGPIDSKIFVAIAQNASSASIAIMTSSNGTSWTNRTAPSNGEWWNVIWIDELSLFICIGSSSGSRVMTSSDGITWTIRSASAENNWKSVTWSPELKLLVAIADTGTNQVMVSLDGITWTSINCPIGSWYNIKWISSLGLFIAVGQHTNYPYNTIIYSSNGYVWNIIQNVNNFAYRAIDWSPLLGVFVLGSINTSNNIYNILKSSANSSNTNIFSIISNYDTQNINISKIIKSNIIKMSTIRYSINKWYNTQAPSQISWSDICWANYPINRFILAANSGTNKLSFLTNALTGGTLLAPTLNINALCWAPEIQRMVAVGSNGTTYTNNLIYYNGSSWTYTTTPSLNNWTSVCWSSCLGMFVAVSNTGYYNRVMISYDAINWYLQKSPNNNWTFICWSGYLKLFVAIANSGTNNRIMTSNNGIDWVSRTSPANNNWSSVCWATHLLLFVAVANSGSGNRIMTSSDGINWSTQNSPADNDWNYIIYISELQLLVAVASTGNQRLMYSRDGINWYLVTLSINNSWKSITWSSEYSILVMISSDGNQQINRSYFFKLTSLNTISNNSYLSIENNKVLFGTQTLSSATHKLEYGPSTVNNNISFYNTSGTSRYQMQITNTGITLNNLNNLNININNHNSIDSGLSLNNNLILSNANQINTLAGVTSGYANASKALVLDNLRNIQGINNVVCNSYTLNSSFNNITEGNASSINLLTTNNNKEITNLNTVGINNLQIKNTNLTTYAKNITSNYIYNTSILNKSSVTRLGTINQVCWSNELQIFVGLGTNGKASISSDGISWASYDTVMSPNVNSICWSPKLKIFVAAANVFSQLIYISTNGIIWNAITAMASATNWDSVVWSNDLNMFAVVAQSNSTVNCIHTSTDGITWTVRTGALGTWTQIIAAKNRFIAISSSLLLISTDGINWTSSSLPSGHSWRSIAYSDILDLFVIVANSGTNRIRTSSDLSTWTIRNHIITNSFTYVTYAKEINTFLIVANSGTDNRILLSNNGIDWYVRSTQNYNNNYQWAVWSPSLYKFVLSSGNNFVITTNSSLLSRYSDNNNFNYEMTLNNILERNIISPDLVNNIVNNFISRSSPVANTLTAICRSDELNLFVAISNTGTSNRIITSPYGMTWTVRTNPVDNNWTSICWSPELNLFVAISNTGTGDRIMTSSDGINWISRSNPVDNNWTSICWAPELTLFVAVSNTGTGDRIMTSSDGITWTSRTNPVDNNWTSICWSPELTLFVAVSSSGTGDRIMTSSDGITWTSRTNPVDNNWTSICWANTINLFIAVANSGNKRIMYSDNGINWTNKININFRNELMIKNIQSYNWNNIIWVSELNIAIAISSTGSQRIMISNDGINWYLKNLTILKNWIALSWSKKAGILCAISTNTSNSIIQSIISYAAENTTIIAYPGQLTINNSNKRIGLGLSTPSYQLHLSTDSAGKLSSSTWTISSDIRLKKDIINADLNLCYNNIKNLPLKRYTWKNEIYSNDQINDRSKLGWIADDVELIFPNSVKKINAFGYDDCKSLNNDQVIVTLYGAIQKLIIISEEKNNIIKNLENQYNSLKTIIDSLEIIE